MTPARPAVPCLFQIERVENPRAALLSYGDNYIKGNRKDMDGAGTLTDVGTQ
jgi:hypothetical protein